MKLTTQIKLLPEIKQKEDLILLGETYMSAYNFISDIAFKNDCLFNASNLHTIAYHEAREKYGILYSKMISNLIREVVSNYKTQKTNLKKKSKLKIKSRHKRKTITKAVKTKKTITFDKNTLRFNDDNTVRLWIFGTHFIIPFKCSDRERELLKKQKGESKLVFRNNDIYIYFIYDVEEQQQIETEDYIGVDLGINNIVATDDGTIISGEEIRNYKIKNLKTRASLQRKASTSTSKSTRKNCRRILKRLSGKELRHTSTINHTISKRLVEKAVKENKGLAFENLEGIRNRRKGRKFNRKLNSWSFFQLGEYTKYKSYIAGVPMIKVPSYMTSQSCSVCGEIGERNRHDFTCPKCGNNDHADVNAAKNIKKRAKEKK